MPNPRVRHFLLPIHYWIASNLKSMNIKMHSLSLLKNKKFMKENPTYCVINSAEPRVLNFKPASFILPSKMILID